MCCNGEEVEYKDILPQWMQDLRKTLGTYAGGQIPPKYGAEPRLATPLPEGFPISAGISPLSFYGADLIRRMSGYPMPQGGMSGYAPTTSYGYGPPTVVPPTPDDGDDDKDKEDPKKPIINGNGDDDDDKNGDEGDISTLGMSPFELYKLSSMLGAISDPYSARQQQARKKYLK